MISSPCMICWHDDLWPNAGCLRLFHQNLRTKWLTSQHFTKVNLQCGLYCAQYTCCSSIWTARQLVHQTSYPSVTVQRHVVLPCLSRDWPTGWQKSSPWPTNRLDNQPPTVTCHSIPRGVFHPHGHNLEAYHSRRSALQLPGHHCVPLQILQGQHHVSSPDNFPVGQVSWFPVAGIV